MCCSNKKKTKLFYHIDCFNPLSADTISYRNLDLIMFPVYVNSRQ